MDRERERARKRERESYYPSVNKQYVNTGELN